MEPQVVFPITYEADGETLPIPLVEIEHDGERVRMILDSGSTHHVFTTAYATRRGLWAIGDEEQGTDHAGESVRVRPIGTVTVGLAGQALDLHETLTIPGPPVLEDLGVAGFISPQRLAGDGKVVLDFHASRGLLYDTSENEALATRARANDDTRDKRLRYVAVEVNEQPVTALLDTGASISEFPAALVDAVVRDETEGGQAMSGARIVGRKVSANVRVAGSEHVDAEILAVANDRFDGQPEEALLGADLLGSCVVLLGGGEARATRLTCRATRPMELSP